MLVPFVVACSAMRHVAVRMAMESLQVCQGGSCGEWGGERLLDAAAVLASGDAHRDLLDVKTCNCCGECPDAVMMRPSSSIPSYAAQAGDVKSALDTAEEAIVAATGQQVDPALRVAFELWAAADTASEESLTAALEAVPASNFEPWQPPLSPEALTFAGTGWEESLHGGCLLLAASTEEPEFGTVTVPPKKAVRLTLTRCVEDGAGTLSGEWEDDGENKGSFELVMSKDGVCSIITVAATAHATTSSALTDSSPRHTSQVASSAERSTQPSQARGNGRACASGLALACAAGGAGSRRHGVWCGCTTCCFPALRSAWLRTMRRAR